MVTTKMICVRLDLDLVEFLSLHPNKNRYINNLIRSAMDEFLRRQKNFFV